MNDDGIQREENENNDGDDNRDVMDKSTEEEGDGLKGDIGDGTAGGKKPNDMDVEEREEEGPPEEQLASLEIQVVNSHQKGMTMWLIPLMSRLRLQVQWQPMK